MKKALLIIAVVLAVLGALVAWATSPASGGTAYQEPVCSESPFITIDTATTGDRTTPSAHSTVGATSASAVWEAGEDDSSAGTSIENENLGVLVDVGETIAVDYSLEGGADPAAGSVRLFVYYSAGADTWAVAPDQFVAAPDDGTSSGTLSITSTGGTIGTIGFVYDTSNGGVEGTVIFSDLAVDERLVSLQRCEEETPSTTTSTTTPPTTDTPTTTAGSDVGAGGQTSDKTCGDFTTLAEFDAHLAAFPGDRDRLDGDDDGIACDDKLFARPIATPATPVVAQPSFTG